MFHGLARDLRLAVRRLVAAPLFTLFAVLSLGIGLAVTTAVYSVVDRVLLRGLGIRAPGEVLFLVTPGIGPWQQVSQPDFHDLAAAQTSLSGLAGSLPLWMPMAFHAGTEVTPGEAVTGAYFSTLGVRAVLGRTILPSDDEADALVIVLSHELWRARFAADPDIVGRTVRMAGQQVQVVGVAAETYQGPSGHLMMASRFWIPLGADRILQPGAMPARRGDDRDVRTLTVLGRLASGRTIEQASADLARIAANLDASYPQRGLWAPQTASPRGWSARRADATYEGSILRRFGLVILALAALVLVVACTNLANLVLARGTMRQQEFAVRRALGASRWRLVREQGVESLLIAAAGTVAAFVVFQALRSVMSVDLPVSPYALLSIEPVLRPEAFAVAAGALLLSLVVFGLEPALTLTRTKDLRADLQASVGSGGVPRARRQRTLLRWQLAISSGFFIIATLCMRYSVMEVRHDSGVDLASIGVASFSGYTQGWDEPRLRQAMSRVLEALQAIPAVQQAAVSTGLPFGTSGGTVGSVTLPDAPATPAPGRKTASAIAVTPSIFATLGVPILRGRGFDSRDHAGSPPVVILSELTAREMLGTRDAVGRQVLIRTGQSRSGASTQLATVVGIARDTDVGRLFGSAWLAYVPFEHHSGQPQFGRTLVVTARSGAGAAAAAQAIRQAIRQAEPDLAIERAGTGPAVLAGPFVFLRAAGFLALGLGGLTLLLAMVGLFGVQSHIVGHRTREIGIRMSFGASAQQIKRMVLKDGYGPVLQGLALGLFIGVSGRAIIVSYLALKPGEIPIVDPWMVSLVPIPILVAAFWACYLPARRAARVDPNVALRQL
jgi:putative ABC transport system permease protein